MVDDQGEGFYNLLHGLGVLRTFMITWCLVRVQATRGQIELHPFKCGSNVNPRSTQSQLKNKWIS